MIPGSLSYCKHVYANVKGICHLVDMDKLYSASLPYGISQLAYFHILDLYPPTLNHTQHCL